MKKILRLILLVLLATIVLSTTVFAVEPRWTNVDNLWLTINSSTYSCTVDGHTGTTKMECTMTLYEQDWLGNRTEVAHYSGTYNGRYHVFTGNYNMQSGKTYILTMDGVVTCNGVSETISCTTERRF